MKVALLQPPSRGSFRGVDFYAERLLSHLQNIANLEVAFVPYNPLARYDSFDLVHSPVFEPYFFSLPILARPRLVVTIHDATRLVFPDHFPAGVRGQTEWAIQKLLLAGKVSHIITDSVTSKKDIVRFYHWPEDKITSIYLAADKAFKKIDSGRSSKEIISKYHLPEKFLLYVGGANWNKNVISLCQAAEKLDTPLVIIGKEWVNPNVDKTNIETESLRQVKDFTDNKPIFIFPGFIPTEELVTIYNLASVYVQPSIYEGFGLPLLEAMNCGTPVVCGRNSSLAEIAEDAAVFADVENSSDLAQKISKVMSLSSKSRQELQQKCLAQAKKFSWDKTAQQTHKVYNRLAENSWRSQGLKAN